MLRKEFSILISVITLSLSAPAGVLGHSFLLEPSLGYKSESTKLVDLSDLQTDIKTNAPVLGLKLGYQSQIGVDLNLYAEYVSGEAQISGLSEKNKFKKESTGAQLAVNSHGAVKMYLGFSLSNEFTVLQSSQLNEFKIKGPCYHVGLVFKLFQYLNLGLQYNLNQYNQISGADYSSGDKIDTYFSKIDTQDYVISLSTTL